MPRSRSQKERNKELEMKLHPRDQLPSAVARSLGASPEQVQQVQKFVAGRPGSYTTEPGGKIKRK